MKTRLTLIAALDRNRLLANEGGIPWRLPQDIAHFRDYTAGKWLLVGRRTFEEMRGWFRPDHTPLVLSATCGWDPPLGRVVASVPQALAMAQLAGAEELVCCGGAQTYAAALPYADRMVLTLIAEMYPAGPGAVRFPAWDPAEWRVLAEKSITRDQAAEPSAIVQTLERRS